MNDPDQAARTERNRRKRAAKKARKVKQRAGALQQRQAQEYATKKSKRQEAAKKSQSKKRAIQPARKQAGPRPSGVPQMTQQKPRRTTPRTPASRTVYEVARRHPGENGKTTTSRPVLLEARDAGELAPLLASALKLDDATARAAAAILSTGAAITADTWQGQTVGRMEFQPAPVRKRGRDSTQSRRPEAPVSETQQPEPHAVLEGGQEPGGAFEQNAMEAHAPARNADAAALREVLPSAESAGLRPAGHTRALRAPPRLPTREDQEDRRQFPWQDDA